MLKITVLGVCNRGNTATSRDLCRHHVGPRTLLFLKPVIPYISLQGFYLQEDLREYFFCVISAQRRDNDC